MSMKEKAKREPLAAIRLKCVKDCMNCSTKAVEECEIKDCPLWPFRFGVRPSTAKKQQRNV